MNRYHSELQHVVDHSRTLLIFAGELLTGKTPSEKRQCNFESAMSAAYLGDR
jgi:hypothetical protein